MQFTNINKCKAGISISAYTKCVRQIIICIHFQVILEPFSPVLLLVFAIKILSPVFHIFFNYKQLKYPTVVSKSNCKQLVSSYFLHLEYEPFVYKSAEHPIAEHCFPTSD